MSLSALLLAASVSLSGVVTFEREGLPFFFMTDDSGVHWRVQRADGSAPGVKVGEKIDVTGERELSVKHRLLVDSLRGKGAADACPAPVETTITEIFRQVMPYGDTPWYGGVFTVEGMLRDINRRQLTTQLLVGEGDCNVQVEIPWLLEESLPRDFIQGATVRVTGVLVYTSIENFEEKIFGRVENIELLPIARDSVAVVRRAPFWNAERASWAVGILLLVLGVIFVWAVTLRYLVAVKTRELKESLVLRETTRIEADAARRERLRLAADLHDGFQQYLAGSMFRLKAAMNYLPADAVETRSQLEKVKDALQHTQSGLRSTLWAMTEESEGPESLMDLFGFVSRRMAHWEGRVRIESVGADRKVARRMAGTLLLILQEAVGNALRHGEAENVGVRVNFESERLILSVIDDGCGFDVGIRSESGHYGLASMERRVTELGGVMSVWSKRGLGSKLIFTIPYAEVI